MAALTISGFLSKWATLFADNATREISEEDMRDFRQDIADSFLNIPDQAFNGVRGFKTSISTITELKALVSSSLDLGVYVVFRDTGSSDTLRIYELVSGTDAESSPNVIRPDDYAGTTNERVWKLAFTPAGSSSFRGNVDLSSDLFPTTGGTGTSGAIRQGNYFRVSVGGNPGGTPVDPNAKIEALVDTPGQTLSNWWIRV